MERGSRVRGPASFRRAGRAGFAVALAVMLAATIAPSVSAATVTFKLQYSKTIGGQVAGAAFDAVLTVRSDGAVDAGYRGTVEFSSSDPQATLPENHSFKAADAGVYHFTVTLRTAGTQTLTATELVLPPGVGVMDTIPDILVVPGTAALLRFTTQPGGATAGSPLSPQPAVEVVDSWLNRVTTVTPTLIFLTLYATSGGAGALTCPIANSTATNYGVATFSGCAVDTAGTYYLEASGPPVVTWTHAGSASFTITSPAPPPTPSTTHFVFTSVPTTVTAGVPFTFTFRAATATDATDTGYRGTVHFTSTDPAFTQPSQHTFTAADAGVYTTQATFAGLGSQNLVVTQNDDNSVYGLAAITVVASRTVSRFAWTSVPATAAAGTPFTMVLSALGSDGLTVPSFTGTVHFTSTDPSATLPTDYTFVTGDRAVHTFGFTLRTNGSQTVTASQVGSSSVTGTSTGIVVSGGASPSPSPSPSTSPSPSPSSALAVTVSSRVVTYPGPVDIAVALAGGAGRVVTLQRRTAGTATWADVAAITLGPDATGSTTLTQEKNAEYRALWAGAATLPAATSASVPVAVRYRVVVTPAATTRTVRAGTTVTWTALVRPSSTPPTVRFRVYQRVGPRWVLSSTTLVRAGADGKAVFRRRFAAIGRFYVETVALSTALNASGVAPKKYLTVR